ncbi:hypothetical protein U1Q18_026562 [Sarracenia purpurea var. burkii]
MLTTEREEEVDMDDGSGTGELDHGASTTDFPPLSQHREREVSRQQQSSPLNSKSQRREKENIHSGYHRDPKGDGNAREGSPEQLPPPEYQVHSGSDDFVNKDVDTDESEGMKKRERESSQTLSLLASPSESVVEQ